MLTKEDDDYCILSEKDQKLKEEIIKEVKEKNIKFIRLNFTDIFGFGKNIEITADALENTLEGDLMFDGSSVDGFGRVEESDMYLIPDLETFKPVPLRPNENGIAQIFCDVYDKDRKPFEGDPRNILKRVLDEAKEMGYDLNVGPEGEFFLFNTDKDGEPRFDIHDNAGYFDNSPVDKGIDARRDMILKMKEVGFTIEASHHEVARGQHEINFKYDQALDVADKWMTFKQIVKNMAKDHDLYASFLPKPFSGDSGNAMHCNQSLIKDGKNVFYDEEGDNKLSKTAEYYVGGLIKYAKEIAAICNPIINSYKRLVPYYEAPTNVAWSASNRSAFIRIPNSRGSRTRIELRTPDPTANPYLVYAVMLKAGLEGIKNKIEPPEMVNKDIYNMSKSQRKEYKVDKYPSNLYEALKYMRDSDLVKDTMGEHAFEVFYNAKIKEWRRFSSEVHDWEIKNYLKNY